jgi:hypothetical protein
MGQLGVAGSDVQRGLRWEPTGVVLYVDENHPGATAVGDGTNPEYPLTTITQAVNNLVGWVTSMACSLEGSVIVVANEATLTETVVVPPTAPANCTILGSGPSIDGPTWGAATDAGTALTIRQEGWTVEGFRFATAAGGTAIRLEWVPGSGYLGNRTKIINNYFDGIWAGLYGIDFYGAPFDTWIVGNTFREYTRDDTTAHAIICTETGTAMPYMNIIQGNIFWENENHISSLDNTRGFCNSIITDNIFKEGVLITATDILVLTAGPGSSGRNTVTRNVFEGLYSVANGYAAHATLPGNWIGNIAEDIGSGQVGDNGFTIAVPV